VGLSACCTANASRAIYFAWRGILSHQEGELRVNLLLNHASPWADVDSHLPYVGRVDVHVKRPCRLSVRIPEWVVQGNVKLSVDGESRSFGWSGRYLDGGQVAEGRKATIEFPLEERTQRVDVPFSDHRRVTVVLRGNEVVEIDPRGLNHPFYQREHYRQGVTLWKRSCDSSPQRHFPFDTE